MKTFLILAIGAVLVGCGADDATTASAPAAVVARANPDPRVDTVRHQHTQLLSIQQEYLLQITQLQGNEKLSAARVKKSEADYAHFIGQSQANLTALDQLDPSKSQEPSQVALVGEIVEKQAHILDMAQRKLAHIHSEHYLPQ